jgi:hypothetical protein
VDRTAKPQTHPAWLLPGMVIGLALVKGLVWTLALPPWYGPDEPSHFAYVQLMAVEGRVPQYALSRDDGRDVPADVQCSENNMGFRLNGPFFAEPPFGPDAARCSRPDTPAARRPEVPSAPTAAYSPLYYAAGVPFYDLVRDAPVETRLEAVRLLSVLLGAAAAGFAYLAGFWAFEGRRSLAAAAAGVFLLQPMVSQQFAIVNNDALLIASAAAFFWRFFRALGRGFGATDAAWMAVLVGLAYLAKPQGIFLAPLVVVAFLMRRVRRPAAVLQIAAAFLLPLGGIVLLGLLGNLLWQGHPLALAGGAGPGLHGAARDYLQAMVADHFSRPYWLWVVSVWGHFVWLSAALPPWVYVVILAVCLAATGGVLLSLPTRRTGGITLLAALVSVAIIGILLQTLELVIYRQTGTFLLQGRSFLEAAPAAAVVITGGLVAWLPRRCEPVGAAGITLAALALNVFSLMVLVEALFG